MYKRKDPTKNGSKISAGAGKTLKLEHTYKRNYIGKTAKSSQIYYFDNHNSRKNPQKVKKMIEYEAYINDKKYPFHVPQDNDKSGNSIGRIFIKKTRSKAIFVGPKPKSKKKDSTNDEDVMHKSGFSYQYLYDISYDFQLKLTGKEAKEAAKREAQKKANGGVVGGLLI